MAAPLLRPILPPVERAGQGYITYWLFDRSSWTMGCGNWGTRYERAEGP